MAVPLHQDQLEHQEAFERAMHRTLTATADYTRRIHWWVRLFGVFWLVSLVLAVLVGVAVSLSIAANAGSTGY